VFAPFVLPQKKMSFASGKANDVMPVHVIAACKRVISVPQAH